ncbi:uncharacterized protein DDB_G0286175 [Lucilia sericata]|uniref:uncharacterized protein DDB_G0286175 n=1 Tax=Lucilia sericata TaxID=13632 RepID=UPI0018A7EC6B|nr:uncharacterized protein DDB_G0286175 [Lucilia sericata]
MNVDANGAVVAPTLLMKPYTYQIFDDYTDELLNERNAVATPLWQTWDKNYYYKRFPLITATTTTTAKTKGNNGNSMTSGEITFENLNDFGSYKIKNAIWPKLKHQNIKANGNNDNDIKQRRHSLQQFVIVHSNEGDGHGFEGDADDKQGSSTMTNIRYKQNEMLPILMEKHFKTKEQDARTTKNKKTYANEDDDLKKNLFPVKDDNTSNNVNDVDETIDEDNTSTEEEDVSVGVAVDKNCIANSNGNGNENLNYADNNVVNTNYKMAQRNDNDHNRDSSDKQHSYTQTNYLIRKSVFKPYDKRAKPSIVHTPFLPAVSGGAMTNLGKFFRDLSKNVHVSEQYQWNSEEQKLLEGDPNFGNIQHHLTKPNAATDQQTAEWIKAIRFYRPSQKIRSLVAMNPHGQWDHSSQFIDPNYMWVGLGK